MTIGEKLLKLHDELMQKGQTDMASTIAGAIIAIDTSIATMVVLMEVLSLSGVGLKAARRKANMPWKY